MYSPSLGRSPEKNRNRPSRASLARAAATASRGDEADHCWSSAARTWPARRPNSPTIQRSAGRARLSRNLTAAPEPFLRAVEPFRDGLVVGCECMHCWYWLADACRDADIAFALGHAWAMRAVHGQKTKCDRHDAEAIARLLKGGAFPLAYAYPKERRGLRDLLRARLRLVRQRAELYGHVHTARRQANLPPVSNDVKYKSKRGAIAADIADAHVRRRVETHLSLLEPLDTTIRRLEAEIEQAAGQIFPAELAVLQSTPGVGPVLSLTILLEIDTIDRFDTRQSSEERRVGKSSGIGS